MQQPLTTSTTTAGATEKHSLSDLDIQASLCLLQMHFDSSTTTKTKKNRKSKSNTSKTGDDHVLQRALWKKEEEENVLEEGDDHEEMSEEAGDDASSRDFLRRNTQLSTLSRDLSLNELRAHFNKPIVEVAREFGICTTFLKKICRRCGIKRWPHRQIRSLTRTIQMLRQAEANTTSSQEKAKFATQIQQLEAKKQAVIENPDANSKLDRVKKSLVNVHKTHNKQRLEDTQGWSPIPVDKGLVTLGEATAAGDSLKSLGSLAIDTSASTNAPGAEMEMDINKNLNTSVPKSVASLYPPSSPHPDALMPAAASVITSDENCGKLLLDMRISPTHRKSFQEIKAQ